MGNIINDLRAGLHQGKSPFRFDRAHKLNEVKFLPLELRVTFAPLPLWRGSGIDATGIEFNHLEVIDYLHACAARFDGLIGFDQLKTAVICEELSTAVDYFPANSRV